MPDYIDMSCSICSDRFTAIREVGGFLDEEEDKVRYKTSHRCV